LKGSGGAVRPLYPQSGAQPLDVEDQRDVSGELLHRRNQPPVPIRAAGPGCAKSAHRGGAPELDIARLRPELLIHSEIWPAHSSGEGLLLPADGVTHNVSSGQLPAHAAAAASSFAVLPGRSGRERRALAKPARAEGSLLPLGRGQGLFANFSRNVILEVAIGIG